MQGTDVFPLFHAEANFYKTAIKLIKKLIVKIKLMVIFVVKLVILR